MRRIASVSVLLLVLSAVHSPPLLARDYVVMISAGRATADNTPINSEYWYDMFLMYNSLIESGYSHDDIFVLYGFGTDFVSSLERYRNPYPHSITDYDNHKQNIESVLGMLGSQMTVGDQVYVWWLGHGSGGGGSLTMHIENYGETVTDVEFAAYMAQIPDYRLRVFSIMTCFSGGIIDNVQGPASIVMTSSTGNETSESDYLCDNYHTEFHYYETCAFDWDTPFGMCGPVDADTNNDLLVSFLEAFIHAETGTQHSSPQLSDQGGHAPFSYLTVNGTPGGLVFDSCHISDDDIGSSSGNGDGMLNPGETIELWVTIRNSGTEIARNITGMLTSESTNATVVTQSTAWDDIPPGGLGTNLTPLVFEISVSALDGESLPFTLTVTDDSGSADMVLRFVVVAPNLSYYFDRLDDTVIGNGNGVLDVGEEVEIYASLANRGGGNAAEVEAQLVSASPYVNVIEGQAGAGSIPAGEVAELTPAYRVQVSGNVPESAVLELDLAISAAGYQSASGFKVKVGTLFFDDVEADGAWSLAAPGDDAETGRWTRVDPIGTLQNGQPCQTEDDHTVAPGTDCFVTGQGTPGGPPGEADVDNGKTTLTTPIFDVTHLISPRVTYWRWYTNNLGNNPDSDWWVVQISPDGGSSWVDLERTMESANDWREMTFFIDDFVTPSSEVTFRFIASDEVGAGSLVEAAVDDFEVSGATQSAAVGNGVQALVFRLARARPNPLRNGTVISFTLPTDGEVALSLYGVDGRLVRMLAEGRTDAGAHDVAWDGSDAAGQRVAPGVYFYRLVAGEKTFSRKLVVVR